MICARDWKRLVGQCLFRASPLAMMTECEPAEIRCHPLRRPAQP